MALLSIFSGVVQSIFRCICCVVDTYSTAFSHNIYEDISVKDLKAEHAKTKREKGDYENMIRKGTLQLTPSLKYFQEALGRKLALIKDLLSIQLKRVGLHHVAGETL